MPLPTLEAGGLLARGAAPSTLTCATHPSVSLLTQPPLSTPQVVAMGAASSNLVGGVSGMLSEMSESQLLNTPPAQPHFDSTMHEALAALGALEERLVSWSKLPACSHGGAGLW